MQTLTVILGAALLAAAVVAAAFAVRKLLPRPGLTMFFGAKSPRRIHIVEEAAVDNKRRLLLVRRDDIEHLVMTGGPADIVIETGIDARHSSVHTQPGSLSAVRTRQAGE